MRTVPSYEVYISQLIRCGGDYSSY